jgi:hypothetical protein
MSTYENRPYNHWHQYTTFTSDINLLSDAGGPPDANGNPRQKPARAIRVLEEGGGTLALRFTSGGTGIFTVTPTDVARGLAVFEATHVTAILSATDVDKVWVGW